MRRWSLMLCVALAGCSTAPDAQPPGDGRTDNVGTPESPRAMTRTSGFPMTGGERHIQEAIDVLAAQLALGITKYGVSRIAVFPIVDVSDTDLTPLANYLAEKLTSALYMTETATVIERTRLSRIMDELELTGSGRFDDASVKKVGKLAGVDAVVMGTYVSVGDQAIDINTRLVSVETAELLGVGSARIPRAPVRELLE